MGTDELDGLYTAKALLQNEFHILEDFNCIHLKLFLLLRKESRCMIMDCF